MRHHRSVLIILPTYQHPHPDQHQHQPHLLHQPQPHHRWVVQGAQGPVPALSRMVQMFRSSQDCPAWEIITAIREKNGAKQQGRGQRSECSAVRTELRSAEQCIEAQSSQRGSAGRTRYLVSSTVHRRMSSFDFSTSSKSSFSTRELNRS